MRTGASVAVIVFARAPRAGAVKTRLASRIGAAAAAELQKRLIRAALGTAFAARCGPVELHVTRRHAWLRTLGVPVRLQRGADLGERMYRALRGRRGAILIGADAPALRAMDLQRAKRLLQGGADVVLSPAEDGGYALIAARRVRAGVFADVEWGGTDVLAQTLRNLEHCRLRYRLLRTVWDVDRPADLERLRSLRKHRVLHCAASGGGP
jgi:rSAM/selenodomain-associated transferase 1